MVTEVHRLLTFVLQRLLDPPQMHRGLSEAKLLKTSQVVPCGPPFESQYTARKIVVAVSAYEGTMHVGLLKLGHQIGY